MDPKDHFIQIYNHQGTAYHELISFEDVDGNLRPALEGITPFRGKILDLGTGTGRIPLLFPEIDITGLDLHRDMLIENQRQQMPDPGSLLQGDMRHLPFPESSYEIITTGWAMGHFTGWFGEDWQTQMKLVLEETERVLQPGGWLIILETMTTGSTTPAPPSPGLAAYYHWLEDNLGFDSQVIQTDYLFDDLAQSYRYAKFFFGDDLAKLVKKQNWVRLPEWTGIWSKQFN